MSENKEQNKLGWKLVNGRFERDFGISATLVVSARPAEVDKPKRLLASVEMGGRTVWADTVRDDLEQAMWLATEAARHLCARMLQNVGGPRNDTTEEADDDLFFGELGHAVDGSELEDPEVAP